MCSPLFDFSALRDCVPGPSRTNAVSRLIAKVNARPDWRERLVGPEGRRQACHCALDQACHGDALSLLSSALKARMLHASRVAPATDDQLRAIAKTKKPVEVIESSGGDALSKGAQANLGPQLFDHDGDDRRASQRLPFMMASPSSFAWMLMNWPRVLTPQWLWHSSWRQILLAARYGLILCACAVTMSSHFSQRLHRRPFCPCVVLSRNVLVLWPFTMAKSNRLASCPRSVASWDGSAFSGHGRARWPPK